MTDLLRAIWEAPEDDDPRSVYADELIAHGDPRGEMIQLQLQRGTFDAQARELELWKAHGAAWLGEFARYPVTVHFQRGFPHALIGDAADIVASARLIREQPIRALVVTSGLDEPALAAMPELDRIASLEMDHGFASNVGPAPMGDDGFARFARIELPALRVLSVANQRLTGMPAAPWWPQLTRLVVRRNPLGTSGIAQVARRLEALRELDLAATGVGDPGIEVLEYLPLTWLRAGWEMGQPPRGRHNRISARGAETIAGLRSLVRLELDHNELGSRGAELLAMLPAVERLSLASCGIGNEGAAAIARGLPAVRFLDLATNDIGASGAVALAEASGLGALFDLDLSDNRLGVDGVEALAHGSGLPELRRLAVSRNRLYTGRTLAYDEFDEPEEESLLATRARFKHRAGLYIS